MAGLVLNETGMEDCGIDDSFKYDLYSVVYSVVFVLGLCTNCAALFVFCFRMKLRNETTLFMTNLALSDLVFVFTLPFKVYYNVNRHWPFGDELCKVSGTAFITNIYGSMLFLTCISVDRFLAIVYPFRSRSVRTRRNAGLVCAAVWLTIVGGGISVTFFSTINQANRATACFEGFSKSTWKTYLSKITIFIEIVGFLLPLLTNLVCSSLVLRTLRRPGTIGHGCNSKRRVLRMILVHLAIFIICFVPYNSILFLYAMVRTQALANCNLERFVRTLYPITLCLATLNCCLDPVVYYFTSESFQKSLTTGGREGCTAPVKLPTSRVLEARSESPLGLASRLTGRIAAQLRNVCTLRSDIRVTLRISSPLSWTPSRVTLRISSPLSWTPSRVTLRISSPLSWTPSRVTPTSPSRLWKYFYHHGTP
uniref:lysophosphatidic acid receptor 4-like n=1 Tax=Oncorhynchus gorbuscha TaxID=8017 RepID=UPI001EAF50A7|nr:lysophosphatidic acid receptor 4-like [Oncorhynchus gorbuscha]